MIYFRQFNGHKYSYDLLSTGYHPFSSILQFTSGFRFRRGDIIVCIHVRFEIIVKIEVTAYVEVSEDHDSIIAVRVRYPGNGCGVPVTGRRNGVIVRIVILFPAAATFLLSKTSSALRVYITKFFILYLSSYSVIRRYDISAHPHICRVTPFRYFSDPSGFLSGALSSRVSQGPIFRNTSVRIFRL